MPSLVQRPSGLINFEGKGKHFLGKAREFFIEANIDNQSKLLSDNKVIR